MCMIDSLTEKQFNNVVARLEGKYIRSDENECWEWIAGKDTFGYGRIYLCTIPKENGRKNIAEGAHRVMWSSHNNQMLGDWEVLHTCDNPSCMNPSHLFIGTNYDNILDRVAKGRSVVGESVNTAELTEQSVIQIRAMGKYLSHSEIAKKYNVWRSTISRVINRKNWKHVK